MELNNFTILDDLAVVSSYSEISSTSVHTVYNVPFFNYLVILIPLLWITNRLVIEFLIIWRERIKK